MENWVETELFNETTNFKFQDKWCHMKYSCTSTQPIFVREAFRRNATNRETVDRIMSFSKKRTSVIDMYFVTHCLILYELTPEMDSWIFYGSLTLQCWNFRFSRYGCLIYVGVFLFYFKIGSSKPPGTIDS
jgi:hypothetical protein